MGAFDQENYEIRSRLPEWWKDDLFLEIINNYSAKIITDILKEFMPYLGVMQPWQLWKTLPEEEDWEHTYGHPTDGTIQDKWLEGKLKLYHGDSLTAYVPNTKRNCDAIIKLKLRSTDSVSSFHKQKVEKLILTNANQTITIRDVDINSVIEIDTESGVVLIDGAEDHSRILSNGIYYNKVQGSFDNIKSEPLDESRMDQLQPNEENKVTKINIQAFTVTEKETEVNGEIQKEVHESSCKLDLSIKLLRPVYVVEQNIRAWSLSAFPLKSIKLYGYFCHQHNFNEGWMYLYERSYALEDRVVYDRITREYDCEIFYATFEYYGIPVPITIGFPQSEYHENPVFETNKALDYWGKIFNLKRRQYNDNITEKEERKTFPKYYVYPIEQDYWYEQRMINEYKDNSTLINGAFLQDTDGNNLAHMSIIDPYAKDIYVYSETIPSMQANNAYLNGNIIYKTIYQHENDQRAWMNYTNIGPDDSYSEIKLNTYTTSAVSNESYMSDILSLYFQIPEDIPKNIKITGLEVDIEGYNNVYLDNVTLTHNSAIYIPQKYQSNIAELTGSELYGYFSNGSFYENEIINEIERDPTYEELIPPNSNYMYINLNEEVDNRYVWNSIKKRYVKLIINIDGNDWIWSINRKEHVPLEIVNNDNYYVYNQIIDKYQPIKKDEQGNLIETPEEEIIYFIAYNKIINGYALKEDLNYNGDQYTDTDIVYDEFYRIKKESIIDTVISYEKIIVPDTYHIYINYLDGKKYVWNNDEYIELYQVQNNTVYSKIDLSENAIWPENNRLLKIGGQNDLLDYTGDITKIQLDQGYILPTNDGDHFYPRTIRVDLQFENDSEQYNADLKIKNVQLKIWYQIVFEEYEVEMTISPTKKTITKKCTRVIDGDTIKVEGLDNSIRLGGINAYETNTDLGYEAKQYLTALCYNQIVTVDLELSNPDAYGRYSGVVYIKDSNNEEQCINQLMLDMGYAVTVEQQWPDREYPSLESLRYDERWRIDIHVKNTGIIPIIYKDLFLILPPEMKYKLAPGMIDPDERLNDVSYVSTAPIIDEEITSITAFAPIRLSLKKFIDENEKPVTEETKDFYMSYNILLHDGDQGLYDIILFYDGKEIRKEIIFKHNLNSLQGC